MNWLGYATPDRVHVVGRDIQHPITRGTICADLEYDASDPILNLFDLNIGRGTRVVAQLETKTHAVLNFFVERWDRAQQFSLPCPTLAHHDTLRFTLAWDQKSGRGRMSIQTRDALMPFLADGPVLPHLDIDEWKSLLDHAQNTMSGQIDCLAFSCGIEPIGPLPTLVSGTPVLTAHGVQPIETLNRGDLVQCRDGTLAPVLHRIDYCAPARGCFAPVTLHAPFFGLRQDVIVAATQRIVIHGSDVEYTFGREAVLVPASSLTDGHAARFWSDAPWVRCHQVILPKNQVLTVAGAGLESMFVGRLRRKPRAVSQTILNGCDTSTLPEHAQSPMPVLRCFEARRFMGSRAA